MIAIPSPEVAGWCVCVCVGWLGGRSSSGHSRRLHAKAATHQTHFLHNLNSLDFSCGPSILATIRKRFSVYSLHFFLLTRHFHKFVLLFTPYPFLSVLHASLPSTLPTHFSSTLPRSLLWPPFSRDCFAHYHFFAPSFAASPAP